MLINLSNHPSANWSEKQLAAAKASYGEIKDYPFPTTSASYSKEQVQALASKTVANIIALSPDAVMCQGEFTLTYAIVSQLKENGIIVISACSERMAKETLLPDGRSEKTAVFDFVQFREY